MSAFHEDTAVRSYTPSKICILRLVDENQTGSLMFYLPKKHADKKQWILLKSSK